MSSALFSWYIANFGTYDATYGSLGAAIGMMMWMWISMIVVLLGAQLNAEIEHQTAKDRRLSRTSLSAGAARSRPIRLEPHRTDGPRIAEQGGQARLGADDAAEDREEARRLRRRRAGPRIEHDREEDVGTTLSTPAAGGTGFQDASRRQKLGASSVGNVRSNAMTEERPIDVSADPESLYRDGIVEEGRFSRAWTERIRDDMMSAFGKRSSGRTARSDWAAQMVSASPTFAALRGSGRCARPRSDRTARSWKSASLLSRA